MSHHRSYEETYGDIRGRHSQDDTETVTKATKYEEKLDSKFGSHSPGRNFKEGPTQGTGDNLDLHDITGSLDKQDKAIVHDVLLGDEKVKGGMPYIQ